MPRKKGEIRSTEEREEKPKGEREIESDEEDDDSVQKEPPKPKQPRQIKAQRQQGDDSAPARRQHNHRHHHHHHHHHRRNRQQRRPAAAPAAPVRLSSTALLAQRGDQSAISRVADALFRINQPGQRAPGAPRGVHAPSQFPEPQPKESTIWDKIDKIIHVAGYATDVGGMLAGIEKMAVPDPDKANSVHNVGSGILNTITAGTKMASSIYSTARHSKRAEKLKGRDSIEYKKSTLNAVSSGIKSLGGLLSVGGSGAALNNDANTAGNMGIAGSAFGSLGALLDMSASADTAEKYRKIANNYSPEEIRKRQNGPNRITDNSVLDAAEMASLTARNKHKENTASSISSAIGLAGSLTGLIGGIVGKGSRSTGGLLGLIGSTVGMIGRAVGDSVGKGVKNDTAASRRQYVNHYLDTEAQKIVAEMRRGDPQRGIPAIGIGTEDAKRIALKKLGMFTGNTAQQDSALHLDDEQMDLIYNGLAMNRAKSIFDSVNSVDGSADGGQMLRDLGLSDDATVEEIAAKLGYEA